MTHPDVVWRVALDYAKHAIAQVDASHAPAAYARGLSDAADAIGTLEDYMPPDVDVTPDEGHGLRTAFMVLLAANVVGAILGTLMVLEGVF